MGSDRKTNQSENKVGRRSLLRQALSKGGAFVGAVLTGATTVATKVSAADAQAPARFKNTGICVRDLDRSILFYTEVFGFKADPEPRKITPALEGYLELKNLDLTVHFIEKEGFRIELLRFKSPEPFGGDRREMNQLGLTHLAFEVASIDSMTQAVEHMGGEGCRKLSV